MTEPRELTEDEVRDQFLAAVWRNIEYAEREERWATPRKKLEGLAFCILSMLDGCAMDMPGFIVAPHVPEEDKQFAIDNGFNWTPYNSGDGVKCDIGGGLHELFRKVGKRREAGENLSTPFGRHLAEEAKKMGWT